MLMQRASALQQQGKTNEAETLYLNATRSYPNEAEPYHQLGIISHARRDFQQAIELISKAIALNPDVPTYHSNMGIMLRAIGDKEAAIGSYRRATELDPGFGAAYYNMGNLYRELQKPQEAITAYKHSLKLQPENVMVHYNLGLTQLEEQLFAESAATFVSAIKLKPDLADAHNNLGNALREMGKIDQAFQCYKRAISINPKHSQAFFNLGNTERIMGNMGESIAYLKKALEINPNNLSIYRYIASTISGTEISADDRKTMEMLLQESADKLGDKERTDLLFALGKIEDDCGNYDKAFAYYLEGNSLFRTSRNPDYTKYDQFIENHIQQFTPELFKRLAPLGDPSRNHIFIIGMPRSGTTLTEQILASHSKVHGAGEVMFFNEIITKIPRLLEVKTPYPACMHELNAETADILRENYERSIQEEASEKVITQFHITDKMPSNLHNLGLISILYPHAKVIYCTRNPLDNCLSIFFQKFTTGNDFAFDLQDIGIWYNNYRRLMDHWRKAIPLPIFEVPYADMVGDMETVSRNMLDFIGLEWEESLLRYYETERPVRTASAWQVRQPLYTTSLDRWKHYEQHLAPLRDELAKYNSSSE